MTTTKATSDLCLDLLKRVFGGDEYRLTLWMFSHSEELGAKPFHLVRAGKHQVLIDWAEARLVKMFVNKLKAQSQEGQQTK